MTPGKKKKTTLFSLQFFLLGEKFGCGAEVEGAGEGGGVSRL